MIPRTVSPGRGFDEYSWLVPDTMTPGERSHRMSLVRSTGTKPEMIVRRLLHAMGYRYRLHARDLPGRPDIVFRRIRKAIFVHGCFWHRHARCPLARLPKSRLDFWLPKLEGNRLRDHRSLRALRKMGWKVLIVWECQVHRPAALRESLRSFLDGEK